MSEIFLQTCRALFSSADNMTTHIMRSRDPALIWKADTTATIRILRDIDWNPTTMGQTPEVVIRSQGTRWMQMNVGAKIDNVDETLEDPEIVGDLIAGRTTLWAISPNGEEAQQIAWEIALFYSAFDRVLCREYGFAKVRPAGVSNPVHIEENVDYWGVAVTIATMWQVTQELIEQKPALAEIIARVTLT